MGGTAGEDLAATSSALAFRTRWQSFVWPDIVPVATLYSSGEADPSAPARELLIGRGVNRTPTAEQGRLL